VGVALVDDQVRPVEPGGHFAQPVAVEVGDAHVAAERRRPLADVGLAVDDVARRGAVGNHDLEPGVGVDLPDGEVEAAHPGAAPLEGAGECVQNEEVRSVRGDDTAPKPDG
jgi:hypothetical protein